MDPDKPFDRSLRRLRRDRAARSPHEADYLHRLAADELLDRLDIVKRDFADVLDLGCGEGYLTGRLRDRGLAVTPADAGALFAARAGGSQCDEDRLPFGPRSFDLVTSVGVLDSVNDLPGALIQIRHVLRPDGLFLGAFLGAGSLGRLRAACYAADEAEGRPASAHVHPQIDVRAAGDLLTRAGLVLPVADSHGVDIRFSSLTDLVADLRAMAGTNLLATRARQPFGRVGLAAASAEFARHAGPDGKTAERIEILYVTGWSPPPDAVPTQPGPRRRLIQPQGDSGTSPPRGSGGT